jgi:ABC-type branched-subunit amino acid transport system substrate-binding protein
MKVITAATRLLAGIAAAGFLTASASAQDSYVIGSSAGLTGYTAILDAAWVDGAKLAIKQINDKGGLLGNTVKLVVEDNRAEPQEAVAAYRKMLSADRAQVFVSGCLSAGNFAAAPFIIRQKIPMVVCSILPNDPNLVAWMFSLLPNPTYEVDTRLQYLKDKTQIREIGILYDQSPYANLQAKLAQGNADKFGLKVVGAEQFQQSDADFGVTIKKLQAAGARAILQMGTGPSSITAAKSLKELALGIPLLTSTDDLSVLVQVAKVLGKDMFFVAGQTQIYGSLADSDPAKKAIAEFVAPWREQYGERDPFWAGRGYDAMMILAAAVRSAKSVDGEKVRDALNVVSAFQGTSGLYNFNADHRGVTRNPFVLAQIVDGKVVIVE